MKYDHKTVIILLNETSGGPNDYSNCAFSLTPKYTVIKSCVNTTSQIQWDMNAKANNLGSLPFFCIAAELLLPGNFIFY